MDADFGLSDWLSLVLCLVTVTIAKYFCPHTICVANAGF